MPYGYAKHTGTTDTPFQWLGSYGVYYDADTELHLTLYRAYSCHLKRFMQADPLGIDGGSNVYMMANLNPLWFIDPYGLCPESSSDIGGYPGGWFNPSNWQRGLFTGDPRASDHVYEEAVWEAGRVLSIFGSDEWKQRTQDRRLPGASVISPWAIVEGTAVSASVKGVEEALRYSATSNYSTIRITNGCYMSGYCASGFRAANVVKGAGNAWAVLGAFYGGYDIGAGLNVYWEMVDEL